jgi:SAM-dependent MidA family methyltransferase
MSSLPIPTLEARQHSEALCHLIRAEIAANGGWISFARYMELALYAPGLGYYSSGPTKFGAPGDFVTAPEISALFGSTLAQQAAQILRLTNGEILEVGAGSGRLALQILTELQRMNALPARYFILEISADLRERQQALLAPFKAQVVWLNTLPSRFTGLILGNEVLDAMPVEMVVWREEAIFQRGVILAGEAFVWDERPLQQGPLFEAAKQLSPPAKYVSEIGLAARAFTSTLASILDAGAILMIDYGFGTSEYYHPQRSSGTLMCHYRHYAHDDPFFLPGLQDITAHVDFSTVAEAGLDAGLTLQGYTTQANFLINCGITALLQQTPAENAIAYLPLAAQTQKLLSPAEMGELFKVIALGKNLAEPLLGFSSGDKRRLL